MIVPIVDCCDCTSTAVKRLKMKADFKMRVGQSGIYFVTKLLADIGVGHEPLFDPTDMQLALQDAAWRLADMGLINGNCFNFLRLAVPWDVAPAAATLGVSPSDILAYEACTLDVPRFVWDGMVGKVRAITYRYGSPDVVNFHPFDMRPRVIRFKTHRAPTQGTDGWW